MKRVIVSNTSAKTERNKICYLLPVTCYLLLLTAFVSAAPVLEFQNNQTQPGETIFATITTSGEFSQQIEKSQIKFFQGRKQVSLESDILYYNSTHYLTIYTTKETNITLQIENILYKEADTLSSSTLSKNLTIQKEIKTFEDSNETYTQILKIKPGHIFTIQNPKLKLTNLGTVAINITHNEQEISIQSLATHELEFTPTSAFSLTKISTYKDFRVPTVYLKAQENTTFVSPTIKADLRQNPDLLLVEAFTETSTQATIELFNFGSDNLTNLEATSSIDFIKIPSLQDIQERGTQNITLELNPEIPGHFQGTINISYIQNETQELLEIPVSIFVLPEGTPEENFEIKEETCQEMSGQVCDIETTICNGTITFTKNFESCCLDSCIKREETSSEAVGSGWIIGIAIFAILGFIGYYFYKKQKQLQSPKPKQTLQATTKKFENRLSGQTNRITGAVTKS